MRCDGGRAEEENEQYAAEWATQRGRERERGREDHVQRSGTFQLPGNKTIHSHRIDACFTSRGLIKDSFFLLPLLHTESHTGLH